MALAEIRPDTRLALARDSAVVVIPVFGSYDVYVQCVRSVVSNTPTEVSLLIADDASVDPAIKGFLHELDAAGSLEHTVYYLRQPENVGFVRNMNTVFSVTTEADVIILNSDCVVPPRWYESLREAAHSDSLVATASTLTNHGTIVSVPYRNGPQPMLPQDWSFEMAAEAVRRYSPKLHPRIPTGIGHCLYVRRPALELVGEFDAAFSPGYGEEVDFCQRCVLAGMTHVVADDLLVLHHGAGSFGQNSEAASLQAEHDALIANRYRYYEDWVQAVATDDRAPLARSLSAASRALMDRSVTIDGRILTRFVTGTQLQTLELVAALARRGDTPIRVVVPPDLGEYARSVLEGLPQVGLLQAAEIDEHVERTQIVHRPYQVSSPADLELLGKLGERIVVTQLDLISYFNPGYHTTFDDWWSYRSLTQSAMAVADRVVFISRHAARSAVADELVDAERASVVYLGTDHRLSEAVGESRRPEGIAKLDGRPFLLCLGTDFRHKNRRFAIRLLEALRTRYDWDGVLLFAGAHVTAGSSAGPEAEYMAVHPDLESHVLDLGAVDEAEKAWLYANAAAVAYPTVHEGFGLLPFEAADAGVPCLFSSTTSLAELLPSATTQLVQWDPEASADRAISLLTDPAARAEHLTALRAAAAALSWDRAAAEFASVYREAAEAPPREAKALGLRISELEVLLEEERAEIHRYDEIDRMLVGEAGALPRELRRALLGIGNRRLFRLIFFKPVILMYRFIYLLKHRRSARKQFGSAAEESR